MMRSRSKPFTGKHSKISLSILVFFLTSLLISSTIVAQQSIASTDEEENGNQEQESQSSDDDQDQDQEDQEQDQNDEEQEDDNPPDDVRMQDPPEAETDAPGLIRDDARSPSENLGWGPNQSQDQGPKITVNPNIFGFDSSPSTDPNPTGPLQPGSDPTQEQTPLPQTDELEPGLTPDPTPMLTPGIVPTTGEDCESKRGEGYLHPSDPCLDILLQQCDAETPQDNPAICGFDPRDNPQGFRCINEAGQWSANVRECFPQYIDIMREKCGSDWDPGEYCLIIGPPKTVYTFGMKVSIGPGGSGEQRPGLHIIECFVDTEGQCIIDAPFNTGIMVSCDDMPVSARAACEASKKSGFDEMRYRYLEQDFWNRFDPEGRYKEVGEKTKEDYERELQDVLDNFKRELDRMGITNPCEDLSDAQCNEWLLNQNNCPGHPACETFDDVFNDYLRNNPDAEWCYNNRDACYDRILGTDHCALGNPLCADPSQSYRPNIEWLEHGPIEPARPCTADNVIGCFDDAPGPYDPLQGNEYPAGYQPTSFDKALKSGANFVSHLGVELLTETGLEAIKGRVPGFPALGVGVFLGVITADGGLDDPKSTWCRSNPWERSCQSLTIDAITGATGARLHDSVCTGTAVTNPLCWDPVPPTPPPPPPPTPRPCTPEDHTGCYD